MVVTASCCGSMFSNALTFFPPTGRGSDVEAGVPVGSARPAVFPPQHGHLRQPQHVQLQGHQPEGPRAAHQLPHRRLDARLQPKLSRVLAQRQSQRGARQRHQEDL